MKKSIFTIAILAVLTCSCKDFLEVKSSKVLSEDEVNSRSELVEANFLSYYPLLRAQMNTIGNMRNTFGYHPYDTWTEDCTDTNPWTFSDKKIWSAGYANSQIFEMTYNWQDSGNYHPYWPYDLINQLNKTIEQFKSLPKSADIDAMLGEAYYIRASLYFGLVQRYGGVPIFDKPFDNEGAINKRTSEKESWDFVKADLDRAIELLPAQSKFASENKDRAILYTALALKSRAMLYAGTIAKYGAEPFNSNYQGISSTLAQQYLKEAAEAAKQVIESGMYSLYTGNYTAIFDGSDKNNNEIIFRFGTNPKTVGLWIWYDRYMLPTRYVNQSGAFSVPTLEAVETFETLDGTISPLDYSKKYTNQSAIFDGRDKRLYADVILPGTTFNGLTMDVYNRTIVHKASGNETYQWADWTEWNERTVVPGHERYYRSGLDGIFFQDAGKGTTNTSFYQKKMMYASKLDKYSEGLGCQDAVVLRYAEVILNFAEAAVELSSLGDASYMAQAQTLFNQLRADHGGLPAKTLTVATVRHERRVETMFESTRYYDIKRWHSGSDIHLFKHHVLFPILHIDETTSPESIYYTFEKADAYNFSATEVKWWEERDYYCPLPSDSTPGLQQNSGWEGTSTALIWDHVND